MGIELLNEPSATEVTLDTLVSFYKRGYQIVRKHSSNAYVIICQRIDNADPFELYEANVGSYNIIVDLHYYNLFSDFFVNMSSVENIQYIHKNRETQLQALNSANGPLVFIGKSNTKIEFPVFVFSDKCISDRLSCLLNSEEWVSEWNVTTGSQTDYQDFLILVGLNSQCSFFWMGLLDT